jgi:hypothetical protein
MFLEINLDKSWTNEEKRRFVSIDTLGKVFVTDLPFENTNGTKLLFNKKL